MENMYLGLCQTSMMERLVTIVNGILSFNYFRKSFHHTYFDMVQNKPLEKSDITVKITTTQCMLYS